MEQIDYRMFFSNVDCAMIVFLEDDFSLSDTEIDKSKFLYSISRMDVESRKAFVLELEKEYSEFALSINRFSDCMENLFSLIESWDNEVIRDDIESAMDIIKVQKPAQYDSLRGLYNAVELPNVDQLAKLLLKYGLCINIPPCYQRIFDEYLLSENRWKPFRIYASFDAENSRSFKCELQEFYKNTTNEFTCLCCIIDNELSGEKRAKNIIDEIRSFNTDKRNSIIGAIVTSHEKTENIDEHVFLEYVNKSSAQSNLQSALLRSTYNYAISKLKDELMKGFLDTFSKATINRNIAFYLSQMAVYEGVANYQIINTWISTMCDYELSKSNVILYIVRLTNLINQVEIEDYEITDDLNMLNTFEAFDFNVNKFYQPPAAGDVFIDNDDKVYILIGQDCDIMMSETRKRRNAISELIPAQIVSQTETFKLKNNLSYMMINNFRKSPEDTPSCLKIDYTKRVYLENELINLCIYNPDGKCGINLDAVLPEDSTKIMMPYLINYYGELQKYFNSIKILKSQAGEAFDIFLDNTYAPRLISIHKYEEETTNKLSYPLRRICRLTETYILYLYKLYLEYRGRQPYNTINLARCQTLDIPISDSAISGEISIQVILSGDRNTNSKPAKLPWEVSRAEILRVLSKFGVEAAPTNKKDYILLETEETRIDLENGQALKVVKKSKPEAKLEIV
ncbi:hypothetical protein SDC9_51093 [bioreactor metagenome]|uniref:Uncharacterized protein n=1 Tax=bioreactor metagenome TaxID=1076179 RepID=A0A644WM02_9ZZZZ|nr:hypothetical protein [Sedimentibacter saalensis]MEA5094970.1 hypothetical protein [Sedimentibacter saalensis]